MSDSTARSLPQGWEAAELGEITWPSRPRHYPRDYPDLPFIGMEHIEAHTMRLLDTVPAHTMKSSAVHFWPGDVLYGRLRPYLNKVYRPEFEGLCSAEFIVFPHSRHFDPRYLQYLLNSSTFVSFASHLNTGDRPRVDYEQLTPYPARLAPLGEQRRIVEEIEKQFTRLDAGVAVLERARANLKRYRASVLQAACEGRLVPTEAELARAEGREYEPADVLLKRVGSRAASVELNDLAEGWTTARFGDLASSFRSGTTAVPEDTPSDLPILRSSSVRQRKVELTDARYLPSTAVDRSAARLENGDLLFVRLSGSLDYVGNCGMVRGLGVRELLFPDRLFRGRLLEERLAPYCELAFATRRVRRHVEAAAKSTAGHQRISMDAITGALIPLPPLAEQERIVAEVDRRLSVTEKLESTVDDGLKRAGALRQSILTSAFKGKLVPQDRGDEPASALLERLRAERSSATRAEDSRRTARGRRGRRGRGVRQGAVAQQPLFERQSGGPA